MATENRSKRLKQPCSPKCENRTATCHTECEKWLEYEKARNANYEARLASKEAAKRTYPSAAFMDKRFRK